MKEDKTMKTKLTSYWVTTIFTALELLAGGVTDLIHGRTALVAGEPVAEVWHTLATQCTCSRSSVCGSSLEPSSCLPRVFLDSRNGRMLAPSLCTRGRLHRA
jgi:hypothetical protein